MVPQPSLEYCAHIISICNKLGNQVHVQILHACMHKCGLESHRVLGNLLVTMLVDVGNLYDAQTIFNKLAYPTDSSWNKLITGYINCEKLHHALGLYQRLQNRAFLHLSGQNFVALLKACAKIKDLERGLEIHGEVARLCMERDVFVGSTVVDMYTKCGSLSKAQEVLNKLPARNVVSWNALMAGYTKYGFGEEALRCFGLMQHEGVSPDSVSFLCSLKACGISGAIEKGRELHAEIERKSLLLVDPAVGNTLVDMYVKCGSIVMARQVFSRLPIRNVVTWTNLIAGLAEHGDTEAASKCFEQMQGEGISPDAVAVVFGLKACGIKEDDDSDKEVDVGIGEEQYEGGFALHNFINETEISCISLEKAKQSHVHCSTAPQIAEDGEHLLNKYSHCELKKIQLQGTSFNKAVSCHSREERGNIEVVTVEKDLIIGNTLIDMYAKSGSLRKAQKVFNSLLNRDHVSWNILIAGYAEHGHGHEALTQFEQMRRDGFLPDIVTYVCVLKACGTVGALEMGLRIHSDITKRGLLEADLVIGSTLVDMFAKCGSLAMAHKLFDMLPVQNVVSWTSLMAGYTRHGFGEEAVKFFDQMQLKGVFPDVAMVISLLKACSNIGATDKGEELHAEIERKGFLERDLAVGNALVDMYAKCGSLSKAQNLFDSLPLHDVVSWNSLIAGYAGHGRGEEALTRFEAMQFEGVSPDAVTYASSLQACSKIGTSDQNEEILSAIRQTKLLKEDPYIGSTLVNMYALCGLLSQAQEVRNVSPVQDASMWNALISACVDHGYGEVALEHFKQMQLEGVVPDIITLICSLRACGNTGAIEVGRELHAKVFQMGFMERDLTVCNTLIDMYVKCGLLGVAQQVFDRLLFRDVVSWTTLISGYAEHSDCAEALSCLECMQVDGVSPDVVTLACCLKACCKAGALSQGQELHYEIVRQGLLERDFAVGNILVNMYGKCGYLTLATEVFERLPAHDTLSWNTLISAYAQQQGGNKGLSVFNRMIRYGTRPDEATFAIVLGSCSRSALFDRSQTYFEAMSKRHSMLPTLRHHACMIDLLSRSGHVSEAVEMVEKLGVLYSPPIWRSVLSACRYWGHVELARDALENTLLLEEKDASAYVLLSHIIQENQF